MNEELENFLTLPEATDVDPHILLGVLGRMLLKIRNELGNPDVPVSNYVAHRSEILRLTNDTKNLLRGIYAQSLPRDKVGTYQRRPADAGTKSGVSHNTRPLLPPPHAPAPNNAPVNSTLNGGSNVVPPTSAVAEVGTN